MKAVLMVMSGMDNHMISWNLRCVRFDLVGLVEVGFLWLWVSHGGTT
jgi:hypothetical protein